ncbi:ABC transporter substrate-binding protein [Haladaptatus salinisoli]|uniref:ABC transporter substrate-binding protein n=1 Tax=Haladaptatus salinisoli TaxID=2884876 RepID=UPI001D0A300B|nr:extracellular solute-binding protein [Haladaptatus salinisoli]
MAAAGVGGIGGLAGCATWQERDRTTTEGPKTEEESESLEIQHSWTAAIEKDASKALFDGFRSFYPETDIDERTVAGRAGGDLQTTIRKRIIEDNPPSSWQAWGGKNLQTYVEAGALATLDDGFWAGETEWNSFSTVSKRLSRVDGSFVAVPLSIHRLNNLFYNVEILEDVGIDPDAIDGPRTLLNEVKTVEEESDAEGLVHATKHVWPTIELWESMLVAEHGVAAHRSIANGNVRSRERAVRNALDLVGRYRELSPQALAPVDWHNAADRFRNGNVAFFHQGDWAAAEFVNDDEFAFGTDWDCVEFPGTEDQYLLGMESFPFPKNNPSSETTARFLRYVGSAEAQRNFAQKRGAIPPRKDVPKAAFAPFFRRQMSQFRRVKTQLPSIAHGLAIAPEPRTKLTNAMKEFTSTWDVDQAVGKIVRVFD